MRWARASDVWDPVDLRRFVGWAFVKFSLFLSIVANKRSQLGQSFINSNLDPINLRSESTAQYSQLTGKSIWRC